MEYLQSTGEFPSCPPTCLLCHTTPNGGEGTSRPSGFVVTLGEQGGLVMASVVASRPDLIGPALKALETLDCVTMPGKVCDTDNDGTPDVAELRQGTDPQGPGQLTECPQYGCGARVATASRSRQRLDGILVIGGFAVIALGFRRRFALTRRWRA
jgi:hypothetical protein